MHNVISAANGACRRLFTAFGTMLYLDGVSGELRHGMPETSPVNVVLATNPDALATVGRGALSHIVDNSLQPIVCSAEASWSANGDRGTDTSLRPADFVITPLDDGLATLSAAGAYLCAESDGRVTHSRTESGPWE